MKLPLWLIALLFVGYSIWASYYWCCNVCQCCAGTPVESSIKQSTGVPLFLWQSDKPESDRNFPDWKKEFLSSAVQGDTLLITGLYRASEVANAAEGNKLGLARAAAIRDLLAPELSANMVKLAAGLTTDSLAAGSAPMESAQFLWRKLQLKKDVVTVIETDKEITFYFPTNSASYIRDAGVDAKVSELVNKHKGTKSTFAITGHTDNVGEDDSNMKLGQARAQSIANLLIKGGIARNRIQVSSKGESTPAADNATEEGKKLNRRVSLTVNN